MINLLLGEPVGRSDTAFFKSCQNSLECLSRLHQRCIFRLGQIESPGNRFIACLDIGRNAQMIMISSRWTLYRDPDDRFIIGNFNAIETAGTGTIIVLMH